MTLVETFIIAAFIGVPFGFLWGLLLAKLTTKARQQRGPQALYTLAPELDRLMQEQAELKSEIKALQEKIR